MDEIKIEYSGKKDENDENASEGKVLINGGEYTTTEAVIIKNGKKVEWKDLPAGAVITELIKDSLYAYETKTIDGTITNYKDLNNIYVDGDKYIVSSDCIYTIDGDETVYDYMDDMDKKKMEKLISRKTIIHLNVAEEIEKIEFGKYLDENTDKKYEDNEYQFMYITSFGVTPNENQVTIRGTNLNGEKVSYKISSSIGCSIGDLVALSNISNKTAQKCEVVEKSNKFGDISVLYDTDNKFYNNAFGEYTLTDDTIIIRVTKKYADNSLDKVEECSVYPIDSIQELGKLDKNKVHIFYNEDMNVDILVVETSVNKITYQVARIAEILVDKEGSKEYNKDNKINLQIVSARMYVIDTVATRYNIVSGDAQVGELVTFEVKDNDLITIKERFRTAFIGYKNDICVEKAINGKTAEVKGTSEILDLNESTYKYNGRIYDLLNYKFIFAKVSKMGKDAEWQFTYAEFVDKKNLTLKSGDRIAFDELSGIAVVYRGYSE